MSLIDPICCVSASLTFVEDIQSDPSSLARSVKKEDTSALFNWMMDSFSYQGISNAVAASYMDTHGRVTWQQIESLLGQKPPCPKLRSYWTYGGCRYDKTSGCCTEPEHRDACCVPSHRLRNGRLNQTAYSLYFFIRDIARRDLPGWIDHQLSSVASDEPNRSRLQQEALIGPMRHVFGVSDKVLTMTLSEVLMAAPKLRPHWFEVGTQLIAIDTLVHNFLHRTGILQKFGAAHAYGAGCYRPGGCADIVRHVSSRIDARRFNPTYPANFPRLCSNALFRFCAADRQNICNGNNIDDSKPCEQIYCIIYAKCSKILLKTK